MIEYDKTADYWAVLVDSLGVDGGEESQKALRSNSF